MSAPETVSCFLSELEALSTFQRTNRPLAGRIATDVQDDIVRGTCSRKLKKPTRRSTVEKIK